MNQYKQQAKSILTPQMKKIIFPVVSFIALLSIFPTLFDSWIAFILGILVLCVKQGNIETAKAILQQREDEIEVSNQGIIGLKHFKKYFSSYFLFDLFGFLGLIVGAIIIYGISFILSPSSMDIILQSDLENINQAILTLMIPTMIYIIYVLVFLIYYNLTYGSFDYLINDECKGINALKASKQYMKSHRMDLVELYFTFFGEFALIILISFIFSLFEQYLSGALLGLIVVLHAVIEAVATAYVIDSKLYLTKYLFFRNFMPFTLENQEIETEEVEERIEIEETETIEFEKISKKKLWLGFFLFVPFYLKFGSYVISILFLLIPFFRDITDTMVLNAWFNFFYDGILLMMGIVIFYDFFIDIFRRFKKSIKGSFILFVLKSYFILYGTSIIGGLLVTLLLGSSQDSLNQSTIEEILSIEPLPMIISIIIFAPILEELIFRGIIFRSFRTINKYLAHFISAFLFGFIHVSEAVLVLHQYGELIQIIPYFIMGLIFSLYYEKHKCIGVNIFLHMLNNLSSCILIMLL